MLQTGSEEITSSCFSPLRREKEQTALFLPHGVKLGFTGAGEMHKQIIKHIKFAARGEEEKWQNLLSPKLHHTCYHPGEVAGAKLHTHTNHSAPLLFRHPVQSPLHCKEGSARPQFATELDHPRRAQGTALRCFSSLGGSIHILMASCPWHMDILIAVSSQSSLQLCCLPHPLPVPVLSQKIPEFVLHIRGNKEPSPAHIIALHLCALLWDAVETIAKNRI